MSVQPVNNTANTPSAEDPNFDDLLQISLKADGGGQKAAQQDTAEPKDDAKRKAADAAMEKSKSEGYTAVDGKTYFAEHDIIKFDSPDKTGSGVIQFEARDGKKYVVSQYDNPELYNRVAAKHSESKDTNGSVAGIRQRHDLPKLEELDLLNKRTQDGPTVSELATKNLLDRYKQLVKDGKVEADSDVAKLVKAIEAKAAMESGHTFTPYVEETRPGGETWRESGKPSQLTDEDMQDILNGDSVDKMLNDLFTNGNGEKDKIGKEYQAELEKAIGQVNDKEKTALSDKLFDTLTSLEYINYLQEMKENGMGTQSQAELAGLISSLELIDPERAKEASATLKQNSILVEVDKLVADPGAIPDEYRELATKDMGAMIKAVLKSADLPRRTQETVEKFLNELVQNKEKLSDFTELTERLNNRTITQAEFDAELLGKYVPMDADSNQFVKAIGKLNSHGVFGSLSAFGSLGGAIYMLTAKNGQLADEPLERLAIAKDFISFLGAGAQFEKTGIFDLFTQTNTADLLGLSKSLPDIWGKESNLGKKIESSLRELGIQGIPEPAIDRNNADIELGEMRNTGTGNVVDELQRLAQRSGLTLTAEQSQQFLNDLITRAGGTPPADYAQYRDLAGLTRDLNIPQEAIAEAINNTPPASPNPSVDDPNRTPPGSPNPSDADPNRTPPGSPTPSDADPTRTPPEDGPTPHNSPAPDIPRPDSPTIPDDDAPRVVPPGQDIPRPDSPTIPGEDAPRVTPPDNRPSATPSGLTTIPEDDILDFRQELNDAVTRDPTPPPTPVDELPGAGLYDDAVESVLGDSPDSSRTPTPDGDRTPTPDGDRTPTPDGNRTPTPGGGEDAGSTRSSTPPSGTAAKVAGSVTKVLGVAPDIMGVADIVMGAFTIKDAIASGSDLGKAKGAMEVVTGVAGTTAGIIGTAGLIGNIGALAGAAAPLFLVGAVLGLATNIIGVFVDHEKKQKATDKEGKWFEDLAGIGLTQEDWGDKLEYARYSFFEHGDRPAPDGQSIFDYQKEEWEHFRNTPGEDGSSINRLDGDKRKEQFDTEFYKENRDVLTFIRNKWDDWNGDDDKVSVKDLEKISGDTDNPDEEKAARWLLNNQAFFDQLDTQWGKGDKDGKISDNDLNTFMRIVGATGDKFDRVFYDENKTVMETIRTRWDVWNGDDNIVSKKDLEKIRDSKDSSDAEKEAARFLLDNNDFFNMLDTAQKASKGGDTKISDEDLLTWLQAIGVEDLKKKDLEHQEDSNDPSHADPNNNIVPN